jgi:hypothetical protein
VDIKEKLVQFFKYNIVQQDLSIASDMESDEYRNSIANKYSNIANLVRCQSSLATIVPC